MDVAGENLIDLDHEMWKQRLDPEGKPIGDRFMEVVSINPWKSRIARSSCTSQGRCSNRGSIASHHSNTASRGGRVHAT